MASTIRILVVDGYPDAADTLADVFRIDGHDVRTARTEAAAVRIVAGGFRPDAVFTEIQLPDSDGYAAAARLAALLPHPPLLVAVTGMPRLDERAEAAGLTLHFRKPVEPQLLLSLVAVYAGRVRHGGCDSSPRSVDGGKHGRCECQSLEAA